MKEAGVSMIKLRLQSSVYREYCEYGWHLFWQFPVRFVRPVVAPPAIPGVITISAYQYDAFEGAMAGYIHSLPPIEDGDVLHIPHITRPTVDTPLTQA